MTYLAFVASVDEEYSPPAKLLGVTMVDDVLFLSIEEYDETFSTRSLKTVDCIAVHREDFVKALLAVDDKRSD